MPKHLSYKAKEGIFKITIIIRRYIFDFSNAAIFHQ
jgi:hypothetical protein